MKLARANGSTSNILRFVVQDSTSTTGGKKTGLAFGTAGLIVSTIANNEATATVYTQAAGNIETITTLGTFAAPTASKCRFKEVDATNHPGLYEIQIADARFAVSNAKSLIITISGATGMVSVDLEIDLATNVATVGDKTGYGLSGTQTFNNTGTWTGGITGSVGSISGITFPTNFSALLISASGHISRVVLVDTITTYTGNTVQTGDSFALANGVNGFVAIKTDSAAIKLKTDNLSNDPADASDIAAAFGAVTSAISSLNNFNPATQKVTPIDVDGLTHASAMEALLAVLLGKAVPSGSTIVFKKQDGTTTKVSITYGSADGERNAPTVS